MGPDAEPFTIMDLVGLVFVIIGFLTYSGFGFASNFIVVQVWKPKSSSPDSPLSCLVLFLSGTAWTNGVCAL
jgi:hypothetical protein